MMQKLSPKQLRDQNRSIQEQGVPLLLPCGLEVRVRNVPLAAFYGTGAIPDSLTPLVDEMLNGKTPDVNKVGIAKMITAQDAMYKAILKSAVVYPRIVDHPEADDEVSLDDFSEEDAGLLVGLLGLPARELARFCQKQSELVVALLAESGISATSEQDSSGERVVTELDGASG